MVPSLSRTMRRSAAERRNALPPCRRTRPVARYFMHLRDSTDELLDALDRLHAKGMTPLVLDLRNNPGGFLDQAIHVAGLRFMAAADYTRVCFCEARNSESSSSCSAGELRTRGFCGRQLHQRSAVERANTSSLNSVPSGRGFINSNVSFIMREGESEVRRPFAIGLCR